MKISSINDTDRGWFIGDFEKASYKTDAFEASYKKHSKGEVWKTHYHEKVTEVNLLIHGTMIIHGVEINSGTIFILEPYEVADPEFITDCEILCIKYPGITNDKVEL